MGSQRVRHDWETELNWTELNSCCFATGRNVGGGDKFYILNCVCIVKSHGTLHLKWVHYIGCSFLSRVFLKNCSVSAGLSETGSEYDTSVQFSSVAQSCPTLRLHGLQHSRPPSPSPTLEVYSNSCPLSRWCHPTTSSSVIPFSSRLQSFPAWGSFPVSQFFASDGRSIGSFSFSISPSFQWTPRTELL